MRKAIATVVISVFLLGISSCGHGICDAYGGRQSDMTKSKKEKIELKQEKKQEQKSLIED